MEVPAKAIELVGQLVQGIQQEIAYNLIGIYPRGSLVHGDFNADTSDIDILVVTKGMVDAEEFVQLAEFHKRIAKIPNPYAKDLEITYIDKDGVRKFQTKHKYPTLERGENETLKWCEHRYNWVLERWTVREYEKVYFGPNPKTLIDPISEKEIVGAVCNRLIDWADWAKDDNDPDWKLPNSHKIYFVETMCRAFYTLKTGKLASKPQSVKWSLENLPSGRLEFVEISQQWQGDDKVDLSVNQSLRKFVLWVASLSDCAT